MTFGTIAAYNVSSPAAVHWAGSVDTLWGDTPSYIGLSAIILNIAVSAILTLVLLAAGCLRARRDPAAPVHR